MVDSSDGATGSWQDLLAQRLDSLGRWAQGRFVLTPGPADETIPAVRYLDPDRLTAEVARAADVPLHNISHGAGDEDDLDLRIAVSRFTRHYCAAMSIVAFAGLAQGVGFNLAADRCTLIIQYEIPFRLSIRVDAEDTLRCAERPASWPVNGPTVETLDELRRYVWRKLYGENIGPVFNQVLTLFGVSPKLIWANAAEWAGMMSDAAEEYLDESAAEPFIADRKALLDAESLPGLDRVNPLSGQLDWVAVDGDGYPQEVQTRRTCCITYLLKDRRGRLCQNCPHLPLEDRVALIRERHGVPMEEAGGSAERRSFEVGLTRLPTRS